MARVLDVAPSSYYKSRTHHLSQKKTNDAELKKAILRIYQASKGRYGAPKILIKLINEGHKTYLKKVQSLMRELGIRSIIRKKYKPAVNHNPVSERENILKQDFTTTSINQKWSADITYIPTMKDGWTYLASVMDLHTRKIIGYAYSKKMNTAIVMEALDKAILNKQSLKDLVIQTDLGSQYTSVEFENKLVTLGVTHSYSRKGTPYDNSSIESFHATLKKEEVYQTTYSDFEHARLALFEYIESWYNRHRIHGAIGYLTPQKMEDYCQSA